jgi:putative phosphoesterase
VGVTLLPAAHLPPPPDRFAVIADVHGNVDALEAVLAEIDAAGIASIINLGDHLSAPLDPAGTARLLMARPDMVLVRGNHDRALLGDRAALGAWDGFTRDHIDAATRDWLAAQAAAVWLGDQVFACHATPIRDDVYLSVVAVPGGTVPRSDQELSEMLAGVNAGLILCGHTHLPAVHRLPDGRMVVNPGSVGCPAYSDTRPVAHVIETGRPDARWCMVARNGSTWDVDLRRTVYDPSRMAALARANGDAELAFALLTGRAR